MKNFLIKTIKKAIIIYIILFSIQFLIDELLDTENICGNNTWYQVFNNKIDADLIILGNSRAEVHYNPQIISNITKLKTYNLGVSGTPINILKIRWDSYINRNPKPKVLVLDLDLNVLGHSNDLFGKFQYLPYLNTSEYISVAKKIDKDFYYERFIPLYKYRGYETAVLKKIKSICDSSDCNNVKDGYVENDIKWIDKDWKNFKSKMLNSNQKKIKLNPEIYDEGLKILNEIIEQCKKEKIKIYFVWSPVYYESSSYLPSNKKYLDSLLNNIAQKEDIRYFNLISDSIAYSKSNFYNQSHLNKNGATLFSNKIAELIKEDLK